MRRIFFLTASSAKLTKEEAAAWTYLRHCKNYQVAKVSLSGLWKGRARLQSCDAIWWHYDRDLEIPDAFCSDEWREVLRSFVSRGGGLFLSLLAAPYVVDLGFERTRPNVVCRGEWTEQSWAPEYPDMRGLAGRHGHPLFSEFRGGPFTWTPAKGDEYSAAIYEGTTPVDGKIIAVEKCYIRLHEHRRIACEYRAGRGTIVTVGTHLFFSKTANRFRPHLELLASKILDYISQPHPQDSSSVVHSRSALGPASWSFDPRNVGSGEETPGRIQWNREPLRSLPETLAVHRDLRVDGGGNELFSLTGRRIVLLGKERGGISEIWCHPTRILRDLRVAFKVGREKFTWSDSLVPELTIRPESLTRRYELCDAAIQETCFPDLTRPAALLSYHISSAERVELVLTAVVDLRVMWPLSEQASGSLRYHWDERSHSVIITGDQDHIASVLCVSETPLECQLAQSEPMSLQRESLKTKTTEQPQVAIGLRVVVNPGRHDLHFVFAGSDRGLSEALASAKALAANPSRSLAGRRRHSTLLERNAVGVETPDTQFNEAIRWALCSLDNSLLETPGLGTSLVAGFGLSSAGWNGGHSISGRPGYAWYFGRDSVWSAFALLGFGHFTAVRSVIEFLGNHQEPTGKILHEMTSSGFAHYDAADATPLFLILMGRYVRSSGDSAFARSHFDWIHRAIQYCFSTDTDRDHLIENTGVGHGWIEGGFLFPSHTEHYLASCWAEALRESAFLARTAGKRQLAAAWAEESRRVSAIVKRDFWNPRTGFYRFSKMHDGTFREDKTILPTVGMYFGCTDIKHSQSSLAAYSSDEFSTDWGVRTVSRNSPSFNPAKYQSGSVWPLMTGWTSLAEYACGRPLQGFAHLRSNVALVGAFSAGRIEEVLHGKECKPVGVCPDQAWSSAMVLLPLIDGLLGLRCDAISKTVSFRPSIPPWWNHLKVKNVRVGGRHFAFAMKRSASESVYTFRGDRDCGLTFRFEPSFPDGTQITGLRINGRSLPTGSARGNNGTRLTIPFRLTDTTTINVRHVMGLSYVCPIPHLRRGETSSGLRLIETLWQHDTYVVTLEGRSGSEYLFEIYDPSQRVKTAEGAFLHTRQRDHLTVLVRFPSQRPSNAYVRKTLRLKV